MRFPLLFALLASAGASTLICGAAEAWDGIQYRSTTCQVQRSSQIISSGRCNAGFGDDGNIRVIKYYWPGGKPELSIIGQQGTEFSDSDRECLVSHYSDGDALLFCTVNSPEELGITGD